MPAKKKTKTGKKTAKEKAKRPAASEKKVDAKSNTRKPSPQKEKNLVLRNTPKSSIKNGGTRQNADPNVTIDFIIVGHNNPPFQEYVAGQKRLAAVSGAYRDVMSNSVLLDGKRLSYMDLLNRVIDKSMNGNATITLDAFDPPNYACLYLSDFLAKRGFGTEIVNSFHNRKEEFEALLQKKPLAVVLTTVFYIDTEPLKEIVSFVRKYSPNTIVITGGPYIFGLCEACDRSTLAYLFKTIGADIYIHDNQGESTLAKLASVLKGEDKAQLDAVPNLIFKKNNEFVWTTREKEDNSLDDNIIDWSRRDPKELRALTYTRTTRSCPFSCSFCTYPVHAGRFVKKDLKALQKELRQLDEIGVKNISFIDDTFNVPPERLKQICRMMMEHQFGFKWISYYRCSLHDPELVSLMADSGCIGALLGIESADPTVLNNMNKQLKPEQSAEAVKCFNDAGIMTYGLFIIGFPGETRDSANRTIEFIETHKPTFYFLHLYYHDVNAPIHRRASEFGLKGSGYNWKHSSMTWQEAADLIDHGNRTISSSILAPLTDFSFETIPYLVGRGIKHSQIMEFMKIAHKMLAKTLGDGPADLSTDELDLIESMKGVSLAV